MFRKQSLSEVVRAMKLAGVLISATALFACGGSGSSTSSGSSSGSSSTSSSASSSSSSSSSSSGFVGTRIRVQAQDYDRFNELDAQRQGATSGVCGFGTVDLVEVNDQNGVCAIGYVTRGEWVEWDVTGIEPGIYNIVSRIASANSNRRVQYSIGGTNVGEIAADSGNWDIYSDRTINNVTIRTSSAVIRATFPDGEINLNYFELVPVSGLPSSSSSSSSSSNASSSSSSSSSSSGAIKGDPVAGLERFSRSCGNCHNHQGDGVFTAITARFDIKDALTRRGGFDGLVTYIQTQMPFGSPGSCDATCALNTAAYMVQFASTGNNPGNPISCEADDSFSYGLRTVRLLNNREYKNSLIDLGLSVASDFADDLLPPDAPLTKSSYPIHMHAKVAIDEARNNAMVHAAEKLAPSAATRLRQSSNCGTSQTNCANAFLTLAERMFRRPLTTEERNTYNQFFTTYGATDGMELAVTAAMTSPQFLYRSELGIPVAQAIQQGMNIGSINGQNKLSLADADAYVLDNYEMASVLSYMYTGSTPDQTLMQAARNNQLNTDAQINMQIDRLLQTARGREHMGEFGANWMRADDVLRQARSAFPELTTQIKQDMAREVRELFNHVFFSDTIPFEQFYGGDFSVVNRRLAQYYGVNNFSGTDNDWRAISIPNRGGIITTGAFMVGNADDVASGPIKRAVDVRELMMCYHIGAPPNDLGSVAERERLKQEALDLEASGIMTSRMYFEKITEATTCQVCHREIINPLFGMEDFDQIGRFRTQMKGMGINGVDGLAIDTSGRLHDPYNTGDLNEYIAFNGSKDLGKKISALPAIQECLIVNGFRYATGLPINEANYSRQGGGQVDEPVLLSEDQKQSFSCAKQQLNEVYESSNHSPKSVYRKIGTLDLIRLRKQIDSSLVN